MELESVDSVGEFGCSRSFRRGAVTRAREEGVRSDQIDLIGRWRQTEAAKGRMPSRRMRDHYTEVTQLLGSRLVFALSL